MVGERLYTDNFKVMETLLAVAFYYVLIVTLFERLFGWLERRWDVLNRKPAPFDVAQARASLPVQPRCHAQKPQRIGKTDFEVNWSQ